MALTVAGVMLLVTWSPWGYRLVRHAVTAVHEGGHALVAVLVGRRLRGIRLHSDTSGLTVSKGRAHGAGMVAMLAAGYPAPAVLGLMGAVVLGTGRAAALLWGLLAATVVLLALVRNLYGLLVVLCAGAVLGAVVWFAPEQVMVFIAHAVVWGLLLVAPRAVVELQRQRARGRGRTSDADQLAGLTGVPALVWVGVFWLVCAAALGIGIWRLVAQFTPGV